jgi:hypothetical protein
MSFLDEITDFVSGAGNTLNKAFAWLNKNEAAADFISGAALGMLEYKLAAEEREAQELRDRREDDRKRVNYAGVGEYTGNLTADGGLLTNGLLSRG